MDILKKSKFYLIDGKIREHIANYKQYAVMLKQEDLKDEQDEYNISLVPIKDLPKLKHINGNVVRKINPNSISLMKKIFLMKGLVNQNVK